VTKVLLIGDYSSLHYTLFEGLRALNCQVSLISNGDGWKNIPTGRNGLDAEGIVGRLFAKSSNAYKVDTLSKIGFGARYDVAQLINPIIFNTKYGINTSIIRRVRHISSRLFLLAAGDDWNYWNIARYKLKYGNFDDVLKYDITDEENKWTKPYAKRITKYLGNIADGIIPCAYEYRLGYEGENNIRLKETIPFPVNTDRIKYKPNKVKGKIRILHGINRYGAKGSKYILEALDLIKSRYSRYIDVVVTKHLCYSDYLKQVEKCNVLIDQCYSYSSGYNGLIALAMGKTVLGGNEREAMYQCSSSACPIINILPSYEDIVKKIELLLDSGLDFEKLGEQGRQYVEECHNYIQISKKYIDVWTH